MKAVIYARTSSEDAGDDSKISVDLQIESCRKLAESSGYVVIGTYSDRDRSGRCYPNCDSAKSTYSIDEVTKKYIESKSIIASRTFRKSLGDIFDNLKNIDIILVYDLTRLMRPLTGSFLENYTIQQLESHKATIHSVDSGLVDYDSFHTRLVQSITNQVSDNQVRITLDKSKDSLREKRENGQLINNPRMLGYESAGKQKVKVIPKEAAIVKEIFQLFIEERLPLLQIVRKLNEEKKLTRKRLYGIIKK